MTGDAWWRDAVCYEIHPRSFADSDGDGSGDLAGVRARLPHLRDLGVDALWLTPFCPSPLVDAGYDISDHTAVAQPTLGTVEDLDALTAEAHALGLRVLVDLVPNHTSSEHPWFRAALGAPAGDPAQGRYIFRPGRGEDGEEPPNDWRSAFGGPAWTRVPDGEWYLHLHAPEQPDLDWRNPEVRAEFERVLRWWLDHGVDGFRVDVAHALFKARGLPDAGPGQHQDPRRNHLMPYYDQEELHPLYRRWRALLTAHPAGPPGSAAPGRAAARRRGRRLRPGSPGPLRTGGRDAAELQLRLPGVRLGPGRAAPGHRGVGCGHGAGRRACHLGPLQPRRRTPRHPLRRRPASASGGRGPRRC